MKKKIIGVLLVASLFLVSGCTKIPKLENGEELVAKLNGKEITANDLYAELRKQYGASILVNMIDEFISNQEIETDTDAEQYADSRIQQLKLQYSSAGEDFATDLVKAGYNSEDAFKEVLIVEYKKTMVVKNYVEDHLTDEEMQKYYKDSIYGDITVRHILVAPVTTDSMTDAEKATAEETALNKAKDLIKQLDEGADFATLAKENSDDSGTKDNGGLYENFNKTGSNAPVEEFFDASVALNDGEYTKEPVKTQYGYHIILKVSQKEKPAFDLVKDDIKDALYEQKSSADTDLSTKTWAEVRKNYNLELFDADIKNIYDTTISQLK